MTHGLAEYIAQEEMGRRAGFWWSADNHWLAFTQVDERHIPVFRINHQGEEPATSDAHEDHRYPFAGQPNAIVRLGVVPLSGGEPVWMDLGDNADIYLARVTWMPDGSLVMQRLSRDQKRLDLLSFDPQTGQGQPLLREENDNWINLHDLFRPLKDGRFIWASERTGYRHLYLYDQRGKLIRPLTTGEWLVDSIAGVDQRREILYFTGTLDGARQNQLYAASFAGETPQRLTSEAGLHAITLDHGKRRFLDVHHSADRPPTIALRSLADGSLIRTIFDEVDPRLHTLPLAAPEMVTLRNRYGTLLYGAFFRPDSGVFGAGPYPTVVWVYGGPHAQKVVNGWDLTVSMRAQYLRSQGHLVFVLDNRGSARRGLEFESPVKCKMGRAEVEDQVDGVEWLIAQGLADKERIGIYGWSYGGYMALMCLARAAELFKVAVAGAPVTDWQGYDTCYTERYMGTPQQNRQAYAESSVLHHVSKIQGKLLLVHGLLDENVHFNHTARLINALTQAGRSYDLLLFPEGRHSLRDLSDRVYLERRIATFFEAHL
jgi:dipeptidyl-peptidase-4